MVRIFLVIKTSLIITFLLSISLNGQAQCTNGTAYGTMAAPIAGGSVSNGCTYATEYNTLNTVAAATSYQSTSSIATDFITVRQGTPGGAVIASGTTPLNWTSTVAGTYYIHINTNATCGTASSCRTITHTHIIPTTPMTYTSSTCAQASTAGLEICATDEKIIRLEVVMSGTINPLDITQLTLRTNGSTAPTTDITNIDVYYSGTSSTFSTANLFGSAAPANTGTDIFVNGTQTLLEGTNYFWISYDINSSATIGNNVDVVCNAINVDAISRTPSTTNPTGGRALIACGRTCPTNATIFTDGFEGTGAVEGVIVGTTYGSAWTGLPRTGLRHAWMNIVNGLSNLDVYERRFDGYYMGCDVTFDYWTLHNSIGFDADYILVDDNNNIIDFNNVVTTAADVNVYQNRLVTFTPTTTGITLRIHCNSTGGAGNDIALDDFTITQCCPVILPVELLNFDVKCNNGKPTLNWTTASEINNDHFTIERSSDMINFKEIAKVNGMGNSSVNSVYKWIDYEPLSSQAYYRLKQTDFNGTTKTFNVVSAKCFEQEDVNIYPNPTSGILNIRLGQEYYNIKIEVKNVLGQIIQVNEYNAIKNINLDIEGENGLYFISIIDNSNNSIHSQKIIKQ